MIETLIIVGLCWVILASIFSKVRDHIEYRKRRGAEWGKEQLMAAEIDKSLQVARYYEAKTWQVLKDSKSGEKFTEEETRAIHKMGLSHYLNSATDEVSLVEGGASPRK
jgi:hypothetical protein